ncbi:MAG: glycosyltransferase [Candidatus Hodarchaeota archaeon]
MENRLIDIGITAYNEEENIENILDSILAQKFDDRIKINSILVVASGCTDRTEELVLKKANKYPHIKLISEKVRRGKASAINLIFKYAQADIIVFIGADELVPNNSINELIKPFKIKEVGAVSGHPIALNNDKQLVGYASCVVWRLHDLYSINYDTKLSGELFAIRSNIIKQIPLVNCDDAMIEIMVVKNGYKIAYARNAKVYIMGPQTVNDFINQRKRVLVGHMQIKKLIGHTIKTMSFVINLKLILLYLKNKGILKHLPRVIFSLILEALAQILAFFSNFRGKYETIWKRIRSAKFLKKS